MYIGAHMSISGGVHKAVELADSIGCTAVQLFTKNNNQWKSKPLTDMEIEQFKSVWKSSGVKMIVAHTGYLINLANPSENWEKSMESMELEMIRADQLGIAYLVLHPGSHLGNGEDWGIKKIADSLNSLYAKHPELTVMVLLETTAGQGTNLGYTFEQLDRIIKLTDQPSRFGICFDTCHVFASGYDIKSVCGYEDTIAKFDKILGLDNLKAFHLNDSKYEFATKVDRHENIGEGTLGLEPFRMILNDKRFKEIPMLLETPKENDLENDIKNLAALKSLIK